MYIDHKDKGAGSRGERIFIFILTGGFLFMMAMEVLSNYEPRKLAMVFFLIFWIPLLFLHEFGHAIMAKLCGWRVKQTVIGLGALLFRGRLFGAPMDVRMIPLEGFVEIAPQNLHGVRWRHALIYFAGPGIELALFFLIAAYLGGMSEMFTIVDDYGRIALQSLGYAALAGAVINLIPLGIRSGENSTPNDGLGIILCAFRSPQDYQAWIDEDRKL